LAILTAFCLLILPPLSAQEAQKRRVQVNVIKVCAPPEADAREMQAALDRVPARPRFTADFEISRGRSAVEGGVSRWVRARREFSADSPFVTAQYTMSVQEGGITETLVLRWRDPKDVVQVALESTVTSGDPAAVLAADTPADHVSVERYGKAPLALRRCSGADQTSLQPVLQRASTLLAGYRAAFGVRSFVPGDLARLGVAQKSAPGAPRKPGKPQ
jgi:hypothetical protein